MEAKFASLHTLKKGKWETIKAVQPEFLEKLRSQFCLLDEHGGGFYCVMLNIWEDGEGWTATTIELSDRYRRLNDFWSKSRSKK